MPTQRPWSTSTRRKRLPRDWERRRRIVRHRAGEQCEWTTDGKRCWRLGTDCDHIVPGDDHSLANLQWLCTEHHKQKTIADRVQSRRRPAEQHPGLVDDS